MGQIPMPRTVGTLTYVQVGARPRGHGLYGQAGRIAHVAHDWYGQNGLRP